MTARSQGTAKNTTRPGDTSHIRVRVPRCAMEKAVFVVVCSAEIIPYAYAFHAPHEKTCVCGYGGMHQMTKTVTFTRVRIVGLLPFCVVLSSRILHVVKSYESTFVPSNA